MRCNGCPVCGLPWIAFVCMAYEKSKIRGISFAEAITSPFLIFLFVAASLIAAIEVYRERRKASVLQGTVSSEI